MPKVTFIDSEGAERTILAEVGYSLMEVARNNDVPGIVAECGGMSACATCHVFIDRAYMDAAGNAGADEASLLEFVDDAQTNSRLACQILITEQLDGVRIITPETQG